MDAEGLVKHDTKVKCDVCGAYYGIGDFPFCKGDPTKHEKPLEHRPFQAYWDEHISPDGPVHVTSHYQRTKLLAKNKSDFRAKGKGMPGQEI